VVIGAVGTFIWTAACNVNFPRGRPDLGAGDLRDEFSSSTGHFSAEFASWSWSFWYGAGSRLTPPDRGQFRPVAAVDAGAYGISQVPAERGVDDLDAADRIADACSDRFPETFDGLGSG